MGVGVLVYGKSGSGKSASLRNFTEGIGVINVIGKPFPFRNMLSQIVTDDYVKIFAVLNQSKALSIVIDDAGYLITNHFMRNHGAGGRGNSIFALYNELADNFWKLFQVIRELPPEKIVYVVMHEEKSDSGDIRLKTIGKMLDEKVCLEGLVTVALRSAYEDERYVFFTQTNGADICKSPMGMFPGRVIDNDLKTVDNTIREYFNLKTKGQ